MLSPGGSWNIFLSFSSVVSVLYYLFFSNQTGFHQNLNLVACKSFLILMWWPGCAVSECFCGKQRREALCTRESNASSEFSCGDLCGRFLGCGLHKCEEECHFGECGPCPLLPESVTHCPCGKSPLASIEGAKPRLSCSDPVPTCGETCGKLLQCGPKGRAHYWLSQL